MDIYGMSSSGQDFSGVDELLDFSNDHGDLFGASATDILHQHHNVTAASTATGCHFQYGVNNDDSNNYNNDIATNYHHHSTDFTDDLCVPSEDVAELEWLSNFVHDSFSDFPANNLAGTINYRPENTSFHSRSRSKRTRAPTNSTSWTSTTPLPTASISEKQTTKLETYSSPTSSSSDTTSEAGLVRRCTHCASEKTPQWRTGPLGPKTLCNACGVRYKSGRLVPEYRPAASPTFVLTQHSNSHRKVMELRRQKEMVHGQQQQQSPTSEYQLYGGGHHHNHNNYEVC
ncbi:GATA transcription factor 4-like [Cynara cardunculus var. scolymus]|uniref:GATA transcription factor n=1 Tax=Cynara cardunculus var. scolymus TaxID=59895 RepID=A0A103XCL6_CYNCS|nr:GATA transcription factor 4-like [Cynara cardunculus var. scolymus]KVH88244.1 Transcription factor, GATA, plant [Cynara cardunculus var. scolymus]